MTFETYGSVWHIDHIKPCSSFDLTKEEEIYKCFNYKNTQPLHKDVNLWKSDKTDEWEDSELNHVIFILRHHFRKRSPSLKK